MSRYEETDASDDTPTMRLIGRHWDRLKACFACAAVSGSGVCVIGVDAPEFDDALAREGVWLGGDAVAVIRSYAEIDRAVRDSDMPRWFHSRVLEAFERGVPVLAFIGRDVALRVARPTGGN